MDRTWHPKIWKVSHCSPKSLKFYYTLQFYKLSIQKINYFLIRPLNPEFLAPPCSKQKRHGGMSTYWFLDNKASAAHELFTKLLSPLVGDVVSRDNKSLTWGHVFSYLVHLAVDYPPVRFLISLLGCKGRGLGSPPVWAGPGS
jgi:hypothetical protein